MSISKYSGNYTKAFLSEKKSSDSSIEATFVDKTIHREKNEAVHIYSFKENKLIYAKGFKEILGLEENEINILNLNSLVTEVFKQFLNEYHDRALLYLYNNNENLDTLSSSVILKVFGLDYPLFLNIKVFKTDDNGNLISIIGRIKFAESLKTTEVVQYDLSGNFDKDFLFKMNHNLDFKSRISKTEITILENIEKELSITEIAKKHTIGVEELETIIENIHSRFGTKSNEELINFALKNHLLPNQFNLFNS